MYPSDPRNAFFKLALFLPALVAMVAVNYTVDPAHVFADNDYVKGIATLLLAGQNVANVGNYDQGLLQQYYAGGLTQAKDILVVGSSRTMQVRSDWFVPHSFFNASVGGATLDDLMATYQIYCEEGFKPPTLILNLDPWYLNSAFHEEPYASLQNEYGKIAGRAGLLTPDGFDLIRPRFDRYVQLFSPVYFQASLRELARRSSTTGYYATTEPVTDGYLKRSDGSLVYNRAGRVKTIAEVRRTAEAEAEDVRLVFGSLDADARRKLEGFLDLLQADGVQVVLFLAPFHPAAYDYWSRSDKYKVILEVERYYQGLATRKHIALVGSYNPANINCGESDFFDREHPKETCLSPLFARGYQTLGARNGR